MAATISIIVPVYKVEMYLDRCVQSIVDQTYPDLEIILVDDGSPDCCPEICDRWGKRDPRIKVIHQENRGLSGARNSGIRVAQGEYLYFVDSDDWIEPTLCEKVMGVFAQNDVQIVTFDCEQITEDGEKHGGTEILTEGVLPSGEALKELLRGRINNYAWNKVYRREVFRDIWFPEGRVFEDMAVAYRLFLKASHVYCLCDRLYDYCIRKNSISHTINGKTLCDIYKNRYECYLYLQSHAPDAAELAFPRAALAALRLYDRSVWESVDEGTCAAALGFLRENREKILREVKSGPFRAYYTFPKLYRLYLVGRHAMGNAVRTAHRLMKRAG